MKPMTCDNAFLWITTERASMTGSTVLARFLDNLLGKWNDVWEKKVVGTKKLLKEKKKRVKTRRTFRVVVPSLLQSNSGTE